MTTMKSMVKAAGCAMSAWTWMLSVILISCRFDGVQLLESYRKAVEGGATIPINDNSSLIHEGWGLPDSVAIVGKIFRYQLPTHDAACGNLTNYQVTVAGEENGDLPSWLTFNKMECSIEGVPRPDVNGQTHNVQVMATCVTGSAGGSPVPIKEYFTIKVVSDDRDQSSEIDSSNAPFEFKSSKRNSATPDDVITPVRCETGGSVTTATVTIDADESRLTSFDRLQLLRRLSAHLGLPETAVRLAGGAVLMHERPGSFDDDGALVAGPGDTKRPTTTGVLVQWDVGCGNVFADHMPVLELLEVSSGNGTMRQAVGHPVVGWHVTSKKSNRRRLKRRVYFVDPTATPTPSAPRPSSRPVPTSIVTETELPPTRIVLTTRTSVTGPEVTKSQLPTASSSRPSKSEMMKPTSVRLTKSPTPTSTYVTVAPSRVTGSEAGTAAPSLDAAITSSMSKNATTTTTTASEYEGSSIEPSVVVTEAVVSLRPTDVLPTRTTTAFATDPVVFPLPSVSPAVTLPTTPSKSPPSTRPTRRPPKTAKPSTSRTKTTAMQINDVPVVLKPLEVIKVIVGRQLSFTIPNDTFGVDGGAENLHLMLLEDGQTIPPSNWIDFNETSNTLYGLALEEDIGTHSYELSARNQNKRVVRTPCIVEVEADDALHEANNEFSVTLDLNYEKVKYDLRARLNLINKIATAFGDKDASKMQILGISRGSVVVTYVNSTLPSEPCPQKEIETLLSLLLQPDGRINETFAKAMEPYRVLKAEGGLAGPCAASTVSSASSTAQALTPQPEITTTTMTTTTKAVEVDVKPRVQQTDSKLLYILLPLLLFLLLLLLIVVICVVCYRRQRRRQKAEDKLTGLHKGIPIIFADELLEDKPETSSVVSTRESRRRSVDDDGGRQSVPPPEYSTSKAGSRSSTLRSDYKSPLISDDDDEDDDEEDGESASPETLPKKTAARGRGDVSTTTPLLHFKN